MLTKDEIEDIVAKRVTVVVQDQTRSLAKSLLPVLSEIVSKVRKIESSQDTLSSNVTQSITPTIMQLKSSIVTENGVLIDSKFTTLQEQIKQIQEGPKLEEIKQKLDSITTVLSPLARTQKEIEELKAQIEILSKDFSLKMGSIQAQPQLQTDSQTTTQLHSRSDVGQQQLRLSDRDQQSEAKPSSSFATYQQPLPGHEGLPPPQDFQPEPPAPIQTHSQQIVPYQQAQQQAQTQAQPQHLLPQPPQSYGTSQDGSVYADRQKSSQNQQQQQQYAPNQPQIGSQPPFPSSQPSLQQPLPQPQPQSTSSQYYGAQPQGPQPFQQFPGQQGSLPGQQPQTQGRQSDTVQPASSVPYTPQGFPYMQAYEQGYPASYRPPETPSQASQMGRIMQQQAQFMPPPPAPFQNPQSSKFMGGMGPMGRQQSMGQGEGGIGFERPPPQQFYGQQQYGQQSQAGPSTSGQNRPSGGRAIVERVVQDISAMGFRPGDVRQEVFQMLQQGEEVDLNKVIDRLTAKGKGI